MPKVWKQVIEGKRRDIKTGTYIAAERMDVQSHLGRSDMLDKVLLAFIAISLNKSG